MSQQTKGPKAFKTNAGISAPLDGYLRMKQDVAADSAGFTGTCEPAGPYDQDVGISQSFVNKAGDHVSVMLSNQEGTRKVRCASVCAIGDRLYPTTNGKVDTLAAAGIGTNGGAIGSGGFIALEACATAGGLVEALPVGFGGAKGGLLFVGTTDSAAAGASSVTEQFFGTNTVTIPANALRVGDVLKITGRIVHTGVHSTDTQATKLYLGEVVVKAVTAFNPTAADETLFEAYCVITAIGATGKVQGGGFFTAGTPGTATARAIALSSTTIDTTAAKVIRASVTMSVSDPGNTAVFRDLVVELVRQ